MTAQREAAAREKRDRREVCAQAIEAWHKPTALDTKSIAAKISSDRMIELRLQTNAITHPLEQALSMARASGKEDHATILEKQLASSEDKIAKANAMFEATIHADQATRLAFAEAGLNVRRVTALLDITCAPATAAAFRALAWGLAERSSRSGPA